MRAHCSQSTLDLISSFQHAVVEDLVERTLAAAEAGSVDTILVSGGVAANSELRDRFMTKSGPMGVNVFFPSRALSTDNAAMIAVAGHAYLERGVRSSLDLDAFSSLPL